MPDDLEKKYNVWHTARNAGGIAENPLNFPWYEVAFKDMKLRANGAVLEIGCGRGEFAVWLSHQLPSLTITAIDFSHDAIEIAKVLAERKNANVYLKQDDAQALSFQDNLFDYVVSCECIEHVPEPARMAKEMYRVLKPGGRFVLTTENYLNGMLLAWSKSWITGKPYDSGSGAQPYENLFFFWNILGYLRSSGLEVERTESCHYQWMLLPRVDPAKLCTKQFSNAFARRLAKPFGRHFSFYGWKPGT